MEADRKGKPMANVTTLTQWRGKDRTGREILIDVWWGRRAGSVVIVGMSLAERNPSEGMATWGAPHELKPVSDDD